MSKKTKILWVVFDFVQAGGQRYVYEICKALSKEKFQITLLKIAPFNSHASFKGEYYYQPTLDIGCEVLFLDELLIKEKKTNSFLDRLNVKVKKKFHSTSNDTSPIKKINKKAILELLNSYDVVSFSGIGVYNNLCINRGITINHGLIHLLMGRFQGENIYKNFEKNNHYNFVSGFESEILSNELEEFSNYNHTYFPLSMECNAFTKKASSNTDKIVISIFTRLSKMKPLDPYLYGFKLLLEKGLDVHLNIYGGGDPEEIGLLRQLDYMYIRDKVTFCGHTPSIKETLLNDNIDVVWFQATNQQIAGYAAIEVALEGFPQVLWDFSYKGANSEEGKVFPSFTDLTEFVNYNYDILKSPDKLHSLAKTQQDFIFNKHNITSTISILEKLYLEYGK
ncbi:hypothetical protein [Dokdonia sp.]|uniref:hypothetical protein n=1 Tax=Dokdonia sp. TaxID=2024995 RepID=UPI0032663140